MSAAEQTAAPTHKEEAIRALDQISFQLIHEHRLTTAHTVNETPGNGVVRKVRKAVEQLPPEQQMLFVSGARYLELGLPGIVEHTKLTETATTAVMRRIGRLAPQSRIRPNGHGKAAPATAQKDGRTTDTGTRKRPPARFAKDRPQRRSPNPGDMPQCRPVAS